MSIRLDNNLISDPIISVIVPMYNSKNVIERAINSVKAQTFCKWELILVNDNSKDNTEEICLNLAKDDARITVLTNNGKSGAYFARKAGIGVARGRFIAFLDSDDYYEPEFLQTLYDVIIENDCEVSCCSYYVAYDNKKKAVRKDKKLTVLNKIETIGSLHEIDGLISSMLWDKLFKREYLADINLSEEIVVGEDYSLLVDTFEKVQKVAVVNIPLYNYYQNPKSVCNFGYTEKRKKTIDNYKKYVNYICRKYPELTYRAKSYLLVQSLAVILSMTKNKNYDNRLIKQLTDLVRKDKKYLYNCKEYKFRYKFSAFVTSISPKILIFLGRARELIF